jgi:hypothetical protein
MSKVVTTFAADDQGMVATIKKIESESKGMAETMQKTESQFKVSFGSMAVAGAGFAVGMAAVKGVFALVSKTVDQFGAALDLGGTLSDLSARTGETSGNLLLLQRAFENSGAGADAVGPTINRLQKFMVDAATGTQKNIEVLDYLGYTYDQLKGKTPTEQMEMFAKRINAIEDPAVKSAVAIRIFGKSGGEMLPLLSSFGQELKNAKEELGSMPKIFNENSSAFDTISDKIKNIKGKFMEFAAGILDKINPALELLVSALARIDAAKLGQDLAQGIIGAGQAMKGFNAALQAMNAGEFGLAWKITWKSIALQAMETINQIYRGFFSTVEATKFLFTNLFDENGAIMKTIVGVFNIIGIKISMMIRSYLADALIDVPVIGEALNKNLEVDLRWMESKIKYNQMIVRREFGQTGEQIAKTYKESGDVFNATWAKTAPIINTTNESFELTELTIKAATLEAERLKKATEETQNEAKKLGTSLEDSALLRSIPKAALQMRKMGDDIKKVKFELTELEKLKVEFIEKKSGRSIEPLKKQFQQELEQERFTKAQSTLRRIENKQLEDELRVNQKGERDRRNIADIARKEGIKTFGKTNEEIRKEILQKRRDEALKKGGAKVDVLGGPLDEKGAAPARKPEEMLLDVVKAIKALVEKIEPKLPTHALAL